MPFDIANIEIPGFEDFTRQPKNAKCQKLDINNIIAEILGGEKPAGAEIQGSYEGDKIQLEGNYSVVLRYRREKDAKNYPAVVMGFDTDEDGNIIIRHIQGIKQARISYRFASGFDSFGYFVELIKQNFTQKGIKVYLPAVPTNLESSSYAAQSPMRYQELTQKLENLNATIEE